MWKFTVSRLHHQKSQIAKVRCKFDFLSFFDWDKFEYLFYDFYTWILWRLKIWDKYDQGFLIILT